MADNNSKPHKDHHRGGETEALVSRRNQEAGQQKFNFTSSGGPGTAASDSPLPSQKKASDRIYNALNSAGRADSFRIRPSNAQAAINM